MVVGVVGKVVGYEWFLLVEGVYYCVGLFSLNDSLVCQFGMVLFVGMIDFLFFWGEGYEDWCGVRSIILCQFFQL